MESVDNNLPTKKEAYQSDKLPTFDIMTGVAGFEPTHNGVKVRCLTAWLYPNDNIITYIIENIGD